MNTLSYPNRNTWAELVKRPEKSVQELEELVKAVFTDVAQFGDAALRKYAKRFDKVESGTFVVSAEAIKASVNNVSQALKEAMNLAKSNIETFHASQAETPVIIETTKGVTCWRESRAIENVGIYIPGGSAPLFSTVLMLGIPAAIAGCKQVTLCTPPDANGAIHPAILYAAQLAGITQIYCIGGIQAIAAMTFGTESIPKADKIFGPGNQYVTAAKQLAQRYGVAIDMPAGPSELLVIADESCYPEFVAADLLSQAEHGEDSQVILLSTSSLVLQQVAAALQQQLTALPRQSIAQAALANSKAVLLQSIDECIDFSNLYAPEHLILATKNYTALIPRIVSAGSVFLGNFSCESAGDYASGTNHTLPTNAYARMYSGVSLDSFIKKITFQELTQEGLERIGPAIEIMAEAEGLIAHKNAVSTRLKTFKNG